MWCTELITNGRRSGWTTLQESVLHPDTSTNPLRMTLPRKAWAQLNCLCTSVRHFCSCLHKWGVASSVASECGAKEQTVEHVFQCPTHQPHGLHSLTVLDNETIEMVAQHLL